MQDPETAALPAVPREPSGAAGCGRGGGAGGREDAEHPDRQLVRQQQQAAARVSEAVPLLQQRLPRYSPGGPRRPDGKQTAPRQTQQPVLPRQKAEAPAGRPPLRPVQIVGGARRTVF